MSLIIDKCLICNTKNINSLYDITDISVSKESFNISECISCGFRWTTNPPTEEECGKYYASESYISHTDTHKGLVNKIYHLVRVMMLRKKAGLLVNKEIDNSLLDFGSGTGYFAGFMKNKGYKVLGIEMDDNARKASIEKFGIDARSPEYLSNGKIENKFGYITLWHVLEHLYDAHGQMEKFYHLLEDNGRLIIAVPNNKSYDCKYFGKDWEAYDVPKHLWHFNAQNIQSLATEHGFQVVQKYSMPFDPFWNSIQSVRKTKGAFISLVLGGFIGLRALIEGYMDTDKASSIIYVMTKTS